MVAAMVWQTAVWLVKQWAATTAVHLAHIQIVMMAVEKVASLAKQTVVRMAACLAVW